MSTWIIYYCLIPVIFNYVLTCPPHELLLFSFNKHTERYFINIVKNIYFPALNIKDKKLHIIIIYIVAKKTLWKE